MPPKKAAGGSKAYHRAEPMPNGEILTDICHKSWRIGKSVGSGGFGEIYLASDDVDKAVNDKANYVVKIEPLSNGPLFVEIAFYIRVAKSDMIEEYKRSRGLESLGMPCYVANGNHEARGHKYRFMVIPRFGQDLHKFIQQKVGRRLNIRAVQALSLQIIDILEYIHEKGFVHGDIKASNLLLGLPSGNKKKQFQQIYAVDFGLAQKYIESDNSHIEYSPDLRKANNGTLEYSSRDAHIGAFSRRGDLEVLGFNMLEWLCGKMPWSADTPHDKVLKQKQALMSDINLKKIYPPEIQGLDIVEKYLKYVQKLDFKEKPSYSHLKDILRKGLPANWKSSLFLDDPGAGVGVKSSKASTKRSALADEVDAIAKKICVPDVTDEDAATNPKRSTRNTIQVKDFNWARILSTDPEKIVRSATSISQHSSTPKEELNVSKTPSPILLNPTPAMLQILSRKKENIRSPIKAKVVEPQGTSELTPAMKEILMRRKKNQTQLFKPEVSTSTTSRRPRRNPQN